MNPYRVLGVAEGASDADIARAYRQHAARMHPDVRGPSDAAHADMVRLNQAYEALRTPELRKQTDAALLAARLRTTRARTVAAASAARQPVQDPFEDLSPVMRAAAKIAQTRPSEEQVWWILGGALVEYWRASR